MGNVEPIMVEEVKAKGSIPVKEFLYKV